VARRQASNVHLDGDVEASGAKLAAPAALLPLVIDFLHWSPIPPKSAKQLAEISARLCRLLRDEVTEQMELANPGLTSLAEEWRKLLFPQATDAEFADRYAQAVTFGLLVARSQDISVAHGTEQTALELKKSNSLIGTALRLLTENPSNQKALKTSLDTLTRVLEAVNWHTVSKDKPEAWLYFYEEFLEVYDNALRKRTGSYYTPPEVVSAMVNLVDEALRGPLFERPAGFAAADVIVADPAVGTGTFLLGVLRRIAETVTADQGAGAVRGAIEAAAKRIIGFEIQFGPFAVAQLRLIAELQALMQSPPLPELRLFITDTLGNPFIEEEQLGQTYEPIAVSRRRANKVKKEERITVVIGNPPYKEKAEGRGGWIERGTGGKLVAPLDWWKAPPAWGIGAHGKHLKNLYIYFWRWATWKVFGSGNYAATGNPDKDEEGIVCFITVSGFLNGKGFQRMRDDLRRTCSEIWVIDCSPEGHAPAVRTRIFQGVKHRVCITVASRKLQKNDQEAARVRFRALAKGSREQKFAELGELSLKSDGWIDCPPNWRDPFLPDASGPWAQFVHLETIFVYEGPGVMPGRTWAISPDSETLQMRWSKLIQEKNPDTKEKLFHPQIRKGKVASRHIRKIVRQPLGLKDTRPTTILADKDDCETPIRYGFRSFDRQWLIPDARLLNDVRPVLWSAFSGRQVYLTTITETSPSSGPAITLTALIPDQDHYNGRGGRAYPLWRDAAASQPNVRPALLAHLAKLYGHPIKAEDGMAYLAAVMAHPAFTARFKADLVRPGLRVPLTAEAKLFAEAVALGSEVVWLHTYGERFVDAAAGRPKGPPRLPKENAPFIPAPGAIPGAPEPLPDTMDYDPTARRLKIGKGFVENVTPEMWAYEVSGKQVLWHWFSYRRRDRSRPIIGDRRQPSELDKIQADHWLPEYTSDLLDLLNVLGRLIALEPRQADLLQRICDGPLLSAEALRNAGAFVAVDERAPTSEKDKKKSKG